MALIEFHRDPTFRQVRQFALGWLPALCVVAAGWSAARYGSWSGAVAFLVAAAAGMLVGLLAPAVMRALLIAWLAVTFPLAWIIAHGLMVVVYFCVITPVGLIQRVCGLDPLASRFDRGASTYWVRRQPPPDVVDYFRPF